MPEDILELDVSASASPVEAAAAVAQASGLTGSRRRDDINRIIIGLGGQGSRIVNELKRHIQHEGEVPPSVEFIAVDSDRIALASLDLVPENQRVYLQAPEEKIAETMVPWLPREFRPKAGGGCGMQRITGKAMYLVHRQRIFETINSVVRALKQRTQYADYMFVIVNAFGGGTGSGMFIDFALDLRKSQTDLVGHEPMIFGIGVLPSRSETIQRANGIAALKELHFLLGRKEPVPIGGRDYSNPFELYFIVGREYLGSEKDDDLLHALVRFTTDLGLIPKSTQAGGANAKGGGFVDLQDIRTLIKGSSHMFATFGYYNAHFPYEELEAYWKVQDRIDELKRLIPKIDGEADGARKGLDDKKVQLKDLEAKVARMKARAKRLRTDGIFGLNKEALVQFHEDIARADDMLRRLREEMSDHATSAPSLEKTKQTAQQELKTLATTLERMETDLTGPILNQNVWVPGLTRAEIDHLRRYRADLPKLGFRETMLLLNRGDEYHEKTLEVIGKNKILFMPMLNYRMAFHTATLFRPEVLRTMSNYGFVRFDAAGNPVLTDDQLWMVLAMLASHESNVETNRLAPRAFKDIVENYVAKRAEVKTLSSDLKRHDVTVYSWMIGINIGSVAPGYPPRLKELEWLMPEYEKLQREKELAQHHAFLYGEPLAFRALTGVAFDRMNREEMNDRLTEFWADYVPLDPVAKWGQLPPLLAEGVTSLDNVQKALQKAARDLASLAPPPETRAKGAPTDLTTVSFTADRAASILRELHDSLLAFRHETQEDHLSLIERITSVTTQLRTSSLQGVRAKDVAGRLIEMGEATSSTLEAAFRALDATRTQAEGQVAAWVRYASSAGPAADPTDRVSASVYARSRRSLDDLAEAALTLRNTLEGTTLALHALQDRLRDLLVVVREKSAPALARANQTGATRSVPIKKNAPFTPDAEEKDVLDSILGNREVNP